MKIDILLGDDWEALYVNGDKYAEDHKIRRNTYVELLEELGANVNIVDAITDEDQGFPQSYKR